MTVQYESVGFSFGDREILRDVSLEIREGEIVGVIGQNGAGKTTLLRLGAGTLGASRGVVRLSGRPVGHFAPKDRARQVAMMEQAFAPPVGLSVRDVVDLGRFPHRGRLAAPSVEDRRAVDEAMAVCEVEDLARRSTETLSGGEYRRVLLAATLAQATPIVLLDEPFAHLDPAHVVRLTRTLGRWRRASRGVGLAAHDVNAMLRVATSIVTLSRGTATEYRSVDDAVGGGAFEQAFGACIHVTRGATGVWVEPRFVEDRPWEGSEAWPLGSPSEAMRKTAEQEAGRKV